MVKNLPNSGLIIKTTTGLELLHCRLAGGDDRLPAPSSFVLTSCTLLIYWGKIHATHVHTHLLHILTYLTISSPKPTLAVPGVTPLSVSFWMSFSVPTKEWEIQYLVKNERVSLQSLNRRQFVAAQNFLAINAQDILPRPGLRAPSGVLVTVNCSEWVWHGALFWVLLVTFTRSLFFECIRVTVQRPTAVVHSVCCIIIILSVLLGEAYNSCARWICSWSGKSETPLY